MRAQIHELKLSVANRTIEKAEHFFTICAENGLDVERILRRDTVALAQLKRPGMEPSTPSSATTNKSIMSPTGPIGSGGGVGRSNSPEMEAEMMRMARERDSLADEVKSLESNYSNLFKLYEKMRENCVQLKVGSMIRDHGYPLQPLNASRQSKTSFDWRSQTSRRSTPASTPSTPISSTTPRRS